MRTTAIFHIYHSLQPNKAHRQNVLLAYVSPAVFNLAAQAEYVRGQVAYVGVEWTGSGSGLGRRQYHRGGNVFFSQNKLVWLIMSSGWLVVRLLTRASQRGWWSIFRSLLGAILPPKCMFTCPDTGERTFSISSPC